MPNYCSVYVTQQTILRMFYYNQSDCWTL